MASPPELLRRRLRLRGDSSFHHLPSGLLIENDVQSIGLRGDGLHDLLSALAASLDGSRTVAEILEPFPDSTREPIASLLEVLFERTVLVDQPTEEEIEVSAAERNRFSAPLDLLTHLLDRPLAGLRAARSSRVLIAGSGPVLTTGAAALLRYGIGNVDWWLAPGIEHDPQSIDQTAEELAADGVESTARRVAGDLGDLAQSLGGYSLVLYACDHSTLRDLIVLNRLCARHRLPLLPGFVFGSRALLGPLLEPPALGCWVCGLHRQSEDLFPPEQAMEFRQPAETPGRVFARELPPSAHLTAVVGQGLAFEAFKVLAGIRRVQCRQGILRTIEESERCCQSDLFPFALGGCTGYCHPFLTSRDTTPPGETSRSDRRSAHA